MKRHSAAEARQHLSDLLDAAERGEGVVIERRGVQFELRSRPKRKRRSHRPSLIASMDPAVDSGQWTWNLGEGGLEFVPRKPRP